MKKIFILFGSAGNLGKDAIKYFAGKDYDKFYFISRKDFIVESSNLNYTKILSGDLSIESNVEQIFSNIMIEPEVEYFLFSTIGGFAGGTKIWDTGVETFDKMMNWNLKTSFLIAKHFSKLVKEAKGGSICFMSAESAFQHEPGKIAYGISKNGIDYLVKTLAKEGKEILLTANGIAPFAIDSAENRQWVSDIKKLVTIEKICDEVFYFFTNHPKICGKIIRV